MAINSTYKKIPGREFYHSYREAILSAFILLNLSTVLFMNRPIWLIRDVNRAMQRHLSPMLSYRFTYLSWLMQSYAFRVGLDNRWQMFGRLPRFNWWFLIHGIYQGPRDVILPLPLQSPRTFAESQFLDIKEGKYHLNLYPPNRFLRERYAHYLCRQFPAFEGAPIQAIVIDLYYRNLLEPPLSAVKETQFSEDSKSSVLDTFQCPQNNS